MLLSMKNHQRKTLKLKSTEVLKYVFGKCEIARVLGISDTDINCLSLNKFLQYCIDLIQMLTKPVK